MKREVVNAVRDAVRTQLWPLPLAGVVIAFVVGVLVPRLDQAVDSSLPGWLNTALFSGDPGAARTVLDAVSSSLITVTSLTFSLTVVTLQLASSQFSPRLLRTFTSDVFVQATLALFLATFTFSLTALRTVRSEGDAQQVFVPRLAVTLSFVLAVASVIGLVVFLAHLARQIRVETMLREVHVDATATLQAALPERGDADPQREVLRAPAHATTLCAPSSGFLVLIDEDDLLRCASQEGIDLVIDRYPGSSLVAGTPIGSFWSLTGPISGQDADRLSGLIAGTLHVGYERTAVQDVGYGLRQLTDVANKALSPGINDPTTAVHALGHISALLCELSDRRLGARLLSDEDGRTRVVLERPDLGDLVDVAITQPRRYGASDPQLMGRLFQLLEELAWRVSPTEQHVVRSQLDRTRATAEGSDFDDTELAQLRQAAQRVTDALAATDGRTP